MGVFDRLLRRVVRSYMHMVGGGISGDFRQDAYANAVVRETVDAIARHAAKLHAVHMRDGERVHDRMDYIIGTRPNPLMSAFDFQYKLFAQALLQNNAFALPVWDRRGELEMLVPVNYGACEALESRENGEVYLRFELLSGKSTVLPYAELIHVRRHFVRALVLGDDNRPVDNAVEMVNVANAGMMSAVRSGSSLRGIIKLKQAQLKDKDVKKRRDEFVADYINGGTDGSGVAGLDASMDYIQLDPSKMYSLSTEQMAQIRANVYRYFGVNEKFVSGTYTEDEWNAAYEAVIEPLAVQMHMAYTHALFTASERKAGESVAVESNRLQYASVKTKIELVKNLGMLGTITFDEARDIFQMPHVPGGDRLIPAWNSGEGPANPFTAPAE